ncbi:MAG: hypothetical protein J6R47_05735 [Acholeplasmatales bacterium]|nr:hypothetical protein [Acholeplasmatales bacterium]
MKTQKSIEWLSGYIYNTLETKCFQILHYNNWGKENLKIPLAKVLFGLSASKNAEITIDDETKEKLYFSILNDINEIFADRFNFEILTYPEAQYIWIEINITRKPKKMTLKEIEHVLGYKIEVIDEPVGKK